MTRIIIIIIIATTMTIHIPTPRTAVPVTPPPENNVAKDIGVDGGKSWFGLSLTQIPAFWALGGTFAPTQKMPQLVYPVMSLLPDYHYMEKLTSSLPDLNLPLFWFSPTFPMFQADDESSLDNSMIEKPLVNPSPWVLAGWTSPSANAKVNRNPSALLQSPGPAAPLRPLATASSNENHSMNQLQYTSPVVADSATTGRYTVGPSAAVKLSVDTTDFDDLDPCDCGADSTNTAHLKSCLRMRMMKERQKDRDLMLFLFWIPCLVSLIALALCR